MEHRAGQLGTQSFFRFLKTANPNGSGCHANPSVAPTNDPAESDTNRLNSLAQPPTAYDHMHHIGSTQNFGHFDGGCNMSSTQVWPPDTHWMVTWLACQLAQPTWHWPPCHTLTRPTTTSSDGMHRSHSRRPTATWLSLLPADEPTSTMNSPRRGRASTPRRHNTPRRHVTPPRPVVIRVDPPADPTPAATTYPWLPRENNWEEDPWTRAEREHAEQQEARAKAKAPPPPAPNAAPEPEAGPPVTPSINPPRQHRVDQTPITRAFETLRQTAGSTVQSIPASVPTPSSAPVSNELNQIAAQADTNPMTQSLMEPDQWLPRYTFSTKDPGQHFGSMVRETTDPIYPPVATNTMQGMPSLLREDSSFQLNSQLLTKFTSLLQNHYPVSMGTWGTILQGNMIPQAPGHQHFDRLQLIPMASETQTADASLLKFWWHQHLLIARNVAQERFANSRAGPTIISDHLQAFLLTAINLMKLARPVGPPYELRQPEGPALASLAETLLDTLQGTMTMDMKMGIATGHIGELVIEGDHQNSRLVFYRTINFAGSSRPRSTSSTQPFNDEVRYESRAISLVSPWYHMWVHTNSRNSQTQPFTCSTYTFTFYRIHHNNISVHILLARAAILCSLWPTLCEPGCTEQRTLSVYRSQWTNRPRDHWSPSSDQIRSLRKQAVSCEILLGIPTLSWLTKRRMKHALHSISQIELWNQAVSCEIYQASPHDMLDEDTTDPQISVDFSDSSHHTFHTW